MKDKNLLRIVVLISGRGTNLQAIIKACNKNIDAKVVGVISNQINAAGLNIAHKNKIAFDAIEHKKFKSRDEFDAQLQKCIKKYNPGLIILAGFMRILGKKFINQFKGKILNIHPSLLPEFPGLNTHKRALEEKKKKHGASVHFVTEELDGGPVVMQATVPIFDYDNEETLQHRVLEKEHIILPQSIDWFSKGRLYLGDNNKIYFDEEVLKSPIQLKE